MLIQFRFQNFKSFRDDTILDLSATKTTDHSNHVVSFGTERLLPAAAIFGANASGKSNVLEAFRFMKTYVMNSFNYGGDSDKKTRKLKHMPFLFDSASCGAVSSFEVYFIRGGVNHSTTCNYGFTLNQDGVQEEWLNTAKSEEDTQQIFYRKGAHLDLSGLPEKIRENIRSSLEQEVLVVSLGAKLKMDLLKEVRDWFYEIEFLNFGVPGEDVLLSRIMPASLDTAAVSYLSVFDPSIVDFQVEKDNSGEYRNVYALHRAKNGATISLPLEQESSGTLKMLTLYPYLQSTLRRGGVLFVDELNSRLHPLLARTFLLTFLNPQINTSHAQIIFTTHDAWQLSNKLFRQDEVWFTAKDEEGVSTLYSLADFPDEEGTSQSAEDYGENYLLGKYGAIPILKNFDVSERKKDG